MIHLMCALFLFWHSNRKLTAKSILLRCYHHCLMSPLDFHLQIFCIHTFRLAYSILFHSIPWFSLHCFKLSRIQPTSVTFTSLGAADSEFQTIMNSWREIGAAATIGSADWSHNQGNCTLAGEKMVPVLFLIAASALNFIARSNAGSTAPRYSFSLHI